MDFLLIRKDKKTQENIQSKYRLSFDVFKEKRKLEVKIFESEDFYLKLYNGLNSKCFYEKYDNGDFIIVLGTLFHKNIFGKNSLKPLYIDFKKGKRNLYNDLIGSYSVVICIENNLFVFNDFLGLMRVYYSKDNSIISTSFLAIAKGLVTKTPSKQEIYEYIIRGGMYGDRTVLEEINLIPRGTSICLNNRFIDRKLEFTYQPLPYSNDFNKMIDFVSDEYINIFKVIGESFGSNITTALSGGYDSRLMLALLRKNNIIPHLYVYGGGKSLDVIVAKNIAKSEGFEIEHIDRDSIDKVKIADYADIVKSNFNFYDGFHVSGIFDNGSDVQTRIQRSSENILQLNGAGGEVWRNFWQLNSSSRNTLNFVRHKWDIYNYEAFNQNFNKKDYFQNFSNKVEFSINKLSNSGKLSRKEIEMIYPLFRYRYWQSIGNSINLNFSYTIMPLMETNFLYPSFDLPIGFKNDGKFEAALIKKIDPRLASYKSDRGFNFLENAPFGSKVKSSIMRNIPLSIKPFLRDKFSNKTKELTAYFLNEEYINQVLPGNKTFIFEYININKIEDPLMFSRALTLEYLFRNI